MKVATVEKDVAEISLADHPAYLHGPSPFKLVPSAVKSPVDRPFNRIPDHIQTVDQLLAKYRVHGFS